jgi:hypothetical protein
VLLALLAAAGPVAAQDRAPAAGADVTAGAAAGDQAAAPAPQDPKPVDGFVVNGFTFKPGGRIKLDIIRDFTPMGNEDAFDTRTIPLGNPEGGNSNLHAKESRLSLDIRGPVEGHELRMYFETDFYGANAVMRLRQAFGTYRGWLAGQAWSTFVDEDNLPRTIDFESPTAFASIRQAQLRYTWKVNAASVSAAVEDNKSAVDVFPGITGKPEFHSPDFVGRLRYDVGSGHIMTSGFTGAARFRFDDADDDDDDPDDDVDVETATLWGWAVSANFGTFGRDTAYGVFTIGEGIGRYRGGTAAVLDANRELHAVPAKAFMAGYEHFWASRWSTNVVYSAGEADDRPFYPDDFNRRLEYGAINLLYWFLGDRGWMGVEYLYGQREVFAGNPNSGTAHRLQYAVRFNLP